VGTFVAVPYLAAAAMLATLQRTLIYLPDREPVPASSSGLPPEQVRDVTLTTGDGLTLDGWLVLARAAAFAENDLAASVHDERPLILYFPGNGGHRGYRLKEIRQLAGLGCHILYFDYRGYAGNPGRPAEEPIASDAREVWRYATSELRVPPERIVLWGESLGGGVAVRLASDVCESGGVPAGLILRSTFTSLADAAGWHYPWLPVRWLLIDRYPSIERIPRIACPLLILHGRRDRIVPFAHGERLFAAAPHTSRNGIPPKFVELPAAGHNDIMYVAAEEVADAVQQFLQATRLSVVGRQPSAESR
jgi:fermentation-respiration switch protein FrsA (DUF1100 family)